MMNEMVAVKKLLLATCVLLFTSNGVFSNSLPSNTQVLNDHSLQQRSPSSQEDPEYTEEKAQIFVNQYNEQAWKEYRKGSIGSWNYSTNLTDHNLQNSLKSSKALAKYKLEWADKAAKYDTKNFTDADLKRQLSMIAEKGSANLEEDEYTEMSTLSANLVEIYSTARVSGKPGDKDQNMSYPLDPDLSKIMATSNDTTLLEWAWKGWRDSSGKKMPQKFEKYTALLNKAAVNNDFQDNGDYWRSWYESETFRADCEKLYQEIKPFYEQLHAYVKNKLKQQYTELNFPETGHIPAHILGNMWAQSWENLESLTKPEPNKPDLDITDELIKQNYTVEKIFRTSEKFFLGLGMPKMTDEFWANSMKEKPSDRDVVCHASAWDFSDKKDFRIKQCTDINQKWFMTTHHEMGHIAYYEQYKDQPTPFRSGANPGFHEAQADVASLSVATPAYLREIGLIPTKKVEDDEADLNFLMQQALAKIAFLPFGYMIDQWRWDIFNGSVSRKDYNRKWWENRCKYQGLSAPVERADDDFDAGSKFHVPNNTPYIRYFVAHIIQYQFHEALCNVSGNTLPLHKCSVHGNKEAGKKLMEMLVMGSSKKWPEAMEKITGGEEMSAAALLNYFKPLSDWLEKENKKNEVVVGWKEECLPWSKAVSGGPSQSGVEGHLILGGFILRYMLG